MFTWRDIRRIAKSVFLRTPTTRAKLHDFHYVLLFINSATRAIYRDYSLDPGSLEMRESYLIIRDCMFELARAMDLFPQSNQVAILEFIRDILASIVGEVQIVPEREGFI